MTQNISETIDTRKPISREKYLLILKTAFAVQSYRFARQAAAHWLATYPGDIEVKVLFARAYIAENNIAQAKEILEKVTSLDPEYTEAWEMLGTILKKKNPEKSVLALECAKFLGSLLNPEVKLPEWAVNLKSAMVELKEGNIGEAEKYVSSVLTLNQDLPIPAIVHMRVGYARKEWLEVHQLASLYHKRWPNCLQFSLYLAEAKLESGDESGALQLLHRCVSEDNNGQVPVYLWGKEHRYCSLWPDQMDVQMEIPIPADVAVYLGLNTLPAGENPKNVSPSGKRSTYSEDGQNLSGDSLQDLISQILSRAATSQDNTNSELIDDSKQNAEINAPIDPVENTMVSTAGLNSGEIEQDQPVPNKARLQKEEPSQYSRKQDETQRGTKSGTLRSIEKAFDNLGQKLNIPDLGRTDGRYPIYVIFSSRTGLSKQYGSQTAGVVDQELKILENVINKRPGWGAIIYYPDDTVCAGQWGIKPIDGLDPWKLKLALTDLDKALGRKGEMIGALLIVGGPDVVPFHVLPNPTDDTDTEVASDNPYGTMDSNYFIPEWPVGRLPGEYGPDAGLLLEQIRGIYQYHQQFIQSSSWWRSIEFITNLFQWIKELITTRAKSLPYPSFGYTAAIWRKASLAVFRPVGDGKELYISPPVFSGGFDTKRITMSDIGYYNLHGLEDAPEWYGQRDVTEAGSNPGPDYPIALTPGDLVKNGRAPQVVFSEACYGAHITNKNDQQALALKFISIGTSIVVGSTCVAYGSVNTPLIGADFLGYQFWIHLNEGLSAGDALMQAKIDLVKEMNKRQGFLDGEDQKTLISFILFGDPLMNYKVAKSNGKKLPRFKEHTDVKTICDRKEDGVSSIKISPAMLKDVKQIVESYLPGLDDADFAVSQQKGYCDCKGHHCPTADLSTKGTAVSENQQTVITISKNVKVANHLHRHYARVTIDKQGKLIKLALSR